MTGINTILFKSAKDSQMNSGARINTASSIRRINDTICALSSHFFSVNLWHMTSQRYHFRPLRQVQWAENNTRITLFPKHSCDIKPINYLCKVIRTIKHHAHRSKGMKKVIFLSLIISAALFSCNKKGDCTSTKVGFYVMDTASYPEPKTYDLYVDNVYRGKIHGLKYTAGCGDSMLLYLTLDSKRHEVDVRNGAGELVNAEYLQLTETKCSSGSGKNSGKVSGGHGSSLMKKTGDDCATMCFTK